MSTSIVTDTDEEMMKYEDALVMSQYPPVLENNPSKKLVYNKSTGRNDIILPMGSGGNVVVGQQPLDKTQEIQRYATDLKNMDMEFNIQDFLAAGYTEQEVNDANVAPEPDLQEKLEAQLFTSSRTEPLDEGEQLLVRRTGQDLVMPNEPTLREKARYGMVYNQEGEFRQIFEVLGFNEKEARSIAEGIFGNATATKDLGIGIADFSPAGLFFGAEEGLNTYNRGRRSGDNLTAALGALEAGASFLEALPITTLAAKGLKASLPKVKNVLLDVKDRVNQPGQMPTVGSNLGNFGQDGKRSFYVSARAGGPENENAKKQILILSQNKKPKVEDLINYFEQNHKTIYGRQLDPNVDADFDTALDAASDEVVYQLNEAVSGKGWYDSDVRKTFEILSETPGLEVLANNETLRVLWSAMAAPTSIGNKVNNNTRAVTAAFLQYLKTGKIPTEPPIAGATTEGISGAGWGAKQKAVASGMRVISHLVETKGLEGFADWWLSPHTLKELTDVRKAAGLGSGPAGIGGGKDTIHLGARVIGDKTGQYSLNINGYQGTTKDMWFARSYNRHFGNMRNPDGSIANQPRNLPERKRMEEFSRGLVDKLVEDGLSEQDAQAVLWFYEQNLFTDLGVVSRPGSFSEAAEKIKNDLRSGIRSSDETQVGAQPGSTELTEFRSISAPKRTVRSERRGREVTGEASNPYTRESGEGAEGNGLLVLNPNEQTQRIYNEVGISLPKINEISSAETASQYNADMTSAMSGHEFGAQVEIKSAEELANARLFKTENGSGFALKPDGDIVAVFQASNETGSVGYSMIQAAIAAGGKKLDAFDTFLSGIYETTGFKPVARLPWNDEFAPDNWDKNTFGDFNNGEPDVIFYVYDPDYFGGATDVPKVTDYDDAVAAQNAELSRLNNTNN